LFWRYAGPVSLILTLVILTIYLRSRGEGLAALGLVALPGRKAKLMLAPQALLAFALFSASVAVTVFGGQAIGLEFMGEESPGVEDRWGDIAGNLPLYLTWLGIAWTAAAFGEEMFFRGFLITRFEALCRGAPFAGVLAVVLSALLFGLGHYYYQGLRGLITTAGIGIAFGTSFLLFKRNLWPLVIVHGIVDTINFSALHFGWE
jgi:membrane protease YdiL (CAAX protease family)